MHLHQVWSLQMGNLIIPIWYQTIHIAFMVSTTFWAQRWWPFPVCRRINRVIEVQAAIRKSRPNMFFLGVLYSESSNMKAEIAGLHFTHSDYMIIYAFFFLSLICIYLCMDFYTCKKTKAKTYPRSFPAPSSHILSTQSLYWNNLPPRSVMLLAF